MFEVTIEDSFDGAHFLKDYDGKCHNLHGHRWKVEVILASLKLKENTQERGMVIDFSKAKEALKSLTQDVFDHSFIYEVGSLPQNMVRDMRDVMGWKLNPVPFRPTAEEFARYFYDQLAMKLEGFHLKVASVTVYETPTNKAIYYVE